MSKPGADPSSGISLGDALRLPKRHPACRRREAQSGSRKKLTCSGHAANSRRYRDLGSTCLCRGREWLDLNGVAKVGQADDGPWRQSGVLKEPRSNLYGAYSHQANERPRCRRRAASLTSLHSLRVGNAGGRLVRNVRTWPAMPREKMLWGGGENLAFIGADLNRWSTPCNLGHKWSGCKSLSYPCRFHSR